jgi:hypothetical protein
LRQGWRRWEWRSVGWQGIRGKQAKAADNAEDDVLQAYQEMRREVGEDKEYRERARCAPGYIRVCGREEGATTAADKEG